MNDHLSRRRALEARLGTVPARPYRMLTELELHRLTTVREGDSVCTCTKPPYCQAARYVPEEGFGHG